MLLLRSLAYLAALALLALSALWGLALYDRLTADPASSGTSVGTTSETVSAENALSSGTVEAGSTTDDAAAAGTPRHWAALFGAPQPPKPPAPPEPQPPTPEPQPPSPPSPPLDSLGYSLKGVVSSGAAQWAIVAHPAGDVILRLGEELTAGLYLLAITEAGLVLGPEGAEPQDPEALQPGDAQKLLRFPE